jgi:hypothetical protein
MVHYRKKRSSHKRHHKGGNAPNPSTYSSASSYGMAVNGTGNQQFDRVFNQSGVDGKFPGNIIVGAQNQNLGYSRSVSQNGGRRRKGTAKRGGFWGQMINQAIVPFSILGLQQTYRRKRGGKKGTKRRH